MKSNALAQRERRTHSVLTGTPGRCQRWNNIAVDIWRGVAEKLACPIVNACWLLNPNAIIIGGGVAKAGKYLFEPLETFIRTQLSTPFYSHLKILPAHFSNDAGIIGAATLGLENACSPE